MVRDTPFDDERSESDHQCKRCGMSTATSVVRSEADDPLEVRECRNCGAVVNIAGHQW